MGGWLLDVRRKVFSLGSLMAPPHLYTHSHRESEQTQQIFPFLERWIYLSISLLLLPRYVRREKGSLRVSLYKYLIHTQFQESSYTSQAPFVFRSIEMENFHVRQIISSLGFKFTPFHFSIFLQFPSLPAYSRVRFSTHETHELLLLLDALYMLRFILQ